jgi:hypothetical protein
MSPAAHRISIVAFRRSNFAKPLLSLTSSCSIWACDLAYSLHLILCYYRDFSYQRNQYARSSRAFLTAGLDFIAAGCGFLAQFGF